MSKEHIAALKGTALCRLLSEAEIGEIASIMELQSVPAGKVLFRDGDPGDGLYLVVAGEVDIVKKAAARERRLARLGTGAVFGEISVVTRDRRTASVRAHVDSSVLRLPAERFQALLQRDSPAALKVVAGIAEVVAERLATTTTKLVELADQFDAAARKSDGVKAEEFVELQRTLQVWSF